MKRIIYSIVLLGILISSCNSNAADEKSAEDKTGIAERISPEKFGIDSSAGVPSGLAIGDRVPGFASRANDGTSFDLYSELQSSPVVLLFYRGKWCPVCRRHMTNLNDSVQLILNKGAKVIAVTPESRDNADEFAAITSTSFPIISDPSGAIMKAFDVRFAVTEDYEARILQSREISIADNNGGDEAMLPVPATYIIGQDGYIRYAQFDLNYRNRASVKDILDNL